MNAVDQPVYPSSVSIWQRIILTAAALLTAGLLIAPQTRLQAQTTVELDQAYRLAAGFYSRSQWSEAEQAFAAIVSQFPQTDQAAASQFFAAECQMQQSKFTQAYLGFQGFLQLHPEHDYAPRATFRMGESAYRNGRHEVAIRLLEEFLRDQPNHPLAEFALPYLGQLRIKRDEPQLAQIAFETALDRYPNGALADDARLGLAQALQQLGNLPEAKRFFDYLVKHQDPEIANQAALQLGVLALKRFDFESAESTFRSLLEQQRAPDLRSEALLWLARTKLEIRDYSAAWKLFQSIDLPAAEDSLAETILFEGAIAAIGTDQHEPAVSWLERLRNSFPEFKKRDQALKLEVQTLTRLNRLDEALALAEKYSLTNELDALQISKLDRQGRDQYESGQFNKAAATFAALVDSEASPTQTQQWQYLQSLALLGATEYQAAEQHLLQLLSSQTLDPELRPLLELALANAQFGLEKFAMAEPHYRKYLQSRSEKPNLRAQLELIICLAKQDKIADADQLLERLFHHDDFQWPANASERADIETAVESIATTLVQTEPAVGQKWLGFLAQHTRDHALETRIASQLAFSGATEAQIDTLPLEKFIAAVENVVRTHADTNDALAIAAVESALARARKLEEPATDDSLTLYRWVLDHTRQPRLLNIARHRLARLLVAAGGRRNLLQAQTLLHRFLKTDQQADPSDRLGINDEVIYQLGWLSIDLQDLREGYRRFEELIDSHPESKYWTDAAYRLIQYRVAKGSFDTASQLIDPLLNRSDVPEEIVIRCLFLQGKICVAKQDWQQLNDAMNTLLTRDLPGPMRAEAQYWLAESNYRRQNFAAAEQLLTQLAGSNNLKQTRQPWARLRLAQCLMERTQWSQAESLARETLKLYPDFERPQELHYLIARCLETRGLLIWFLEIRVCGRRPGPPGPDRHKKTPVPGTGVSCGSRKSLLEDSVCSGSGSDGLRAAAKLGIGLHAQLDLVQAQHFIFFMDTDAHRDLQGQPQDGAGDDGEGADRQDADHLGADIAAAENADRKGAPDAADQMRRDRAHHVIDLQLVQDRHGNHHQHAADTADDDGHEMVGQVRARRDGDQAADRAVERHGQVDFLVDQLGQGHGDDNAGGGRQVGVGEDDGHPGRVGGAIQRQHGTAVETEPAEPQDEGSKRRQRQVRARERVDRAVLAVFAATRAQDDGADQGGPAADAMHDRGAGKIGEAHLGQPAATPGPGPLDWVDDAGQDDGEQQERPQFDPLGKRPGNDRGRGGDKHHLEEPVGGDRIAVADDSADLLGSGLFGAKQCQLGFGGIVEGAAQRADPARDIGIHQAIADQVIHQPGDGIERDVFQADGGGVLGSHQAGFQHGEPGGHPHDQRAVHQEGKGVEDITGLGGDLGMGGRGENQGQHSAKTRYFPRIHQNFLGF